MPSLVNGSMRWTLEEATTPEILRGYKGEVVTHTDETVTIKFPTMHHAASWANTVELENQTWPSKEVLSFADWVTVDVMDPES